MSSDNHKKSETLRQRDKARKDFLELKRMQQENENNNTEHVAYSGEIKPVTFGEKVSHFFYYHSVAVVLVIVAIAIVAFVTVSCLNRVAPDLKIVVYDNRILADMYVGNIEEYFEKICPDYNGDGKVCVSVINCTYETGVSTAQYQNTIMQRLQGIVVTDTTCMLVITSEKGYDYFTNYINGMVLTSPLPLPPSYYSECATDKDLPIPDGMTVYCRDISETLMSGNKEAQAAVKNGLDFISLLKEVK